MKSSKLLIPGALLCCSALTTHAQITVAFFGGDYVTANQSSQATLQDLLGVPTASDSIRQVGGWSSLANPVIGVDYTGPEFYGGAQAVKFGVNANNGAATAEIVDDAGGDYIKLFAQSPSGTTNSHLSFVALWDVSPVSYDNIASFSGRTAGGVSGSVVSRFIVQTSGGDYYVSNTTISGGNGGSTWSITDIGAESWALFTPDTAGNWRGDYASLTFDQSLSGSTVEAVGWFASRDSGVAGFTNSTLTIRNFEVTAIPEPSTYAALLGALGLGLVIYRRRRA